MATTAHHLNRRGAHRRLVCALLFAVSIAATPAMRPASAVDPEELEGRAPTKAELVPSVEAAFPRESYRPGSVASLRLFNRARGITMQLFRVGPETVRTRNNEMQGVPVSAPRAIGSSRAGRVVRVPVGDWPSGLYFARLAAADGRVG